MKFRIFPLLFLIVLLPAACETGQQPRDHLVARNGMVVAAESLAAAAGAEVLRRGGNAIDAAVATGFALAVTYPEAGNIGGGGFMLIRLADGTSTFIDFRERAPGAATRRMFLDSVGNVIPKKSETGPISAGVPGTVAGLLMALDRYGTLDRTTLLEKAITLATNGIRVDRRLAASLETFTPEFLPFVSSREAFTKSGTPYKEGDILRQPDLAKTLASIRDRGARGFYSGMIARFIVDEMKRSGGIITMEDLETYEAVERKPLSGTYRGHGILTAPPPSAGGIALLQMLNMLERYDLANAGHLTARTSHLLAAVAQRAYADRAEYPGDPDFVEVPTEVLISKEYAVSRTSDIDTIHATASIQVTPGVVEQLIDKQTTHYCVADRFGNVVSTTVTLNGYYGSKTVVGRAGFFLNNEMDDFVAKAGAPNQFGLVGAEANSIAPYKRMLSSMTPTIVLKNGAPILLVGGRGGSRISTAVMQVVVNILDFGMNVAASVDAPRIHHQWLPDELLYETGGLARDVIDRLTAMGYLVKETPDPNGRCQAIMIDPASGLFNGGPDAREQGVAIGY